RLWLLLVRPACGSGLRRLTRDRGAGGQPPLFTEVILSSTPSRRTDFSGTSHTFLPFHSLPAGHVLAQQRPNVFSMSVANILPQDRAERLLPPRRPRTGSGVAESPDAVSLSGAARTRN